MSDFKIQAAGGGAYDLVLEDTGKGDDLVLIGDTEDTWPELVVQRVNYAVGTWLGETAFDRGLGFPWRQGVFGKQPVEGIVFLLYDAIISVPGVEAMPDAPVVEVDAQRRASISIEILGQGFDEGRAVEQIVQEPTV